MKVAVIGYGHVGMAVFSSLLNMREIHELVLVGRNSDRIEGELIDYQDALAINTSIRTRISGGGYEKCTGADIIIYTAGPAVKDLSQTRLDIAGDSVEVAREVCSELNKYNRDAVMIVISNPVDVIVSAMIRFTGRPREKVIGTGTLLDTARLRRFTADILKVRPQNITTCVLGEHGNSSCIIWSWTRILGMDIHEFLTAELNGELAIGRERLLEINRQMGNLIYEKKGSTAYGVAAAASQITSAIIYDTHEILPVSVRLEGEFGISGVAMSVPCYVSRSGADPITGAKLDDSEIAGLKASGEVIREITDRFL